VAEVFVNGKMAGVLWMSPFRVDVTGMLVGGGNNLKILVTNTWNNFVRGPKYSKPIEVPGPLQGHFGMAAKEVFNNEMYPWDQRELKMISKDLPVSGLIGNII
jgi:beta-galactosidase/beta-glucuronidase